MKYNHQCQKEIKGIATRFHNELESYILSHQFNEKDIFKIKQILDLTFKLLFIYLNVKAKRAKNKRS